jgi:hypothetical protein
VSTPIVLGPLCLTNFEASRTGDIDVREDCLSTFCRIELGPAEVGRDDVGPDEDGPAEVGPAEVGPADVDMRIIVTGDKDWSCPDLAARILRRLVARYDRDIIIIHGNEPEVDASFAGAAKELGITAEALVIDRKNTGFPTLGQRSRELLLGGADMCLAVHNRVASCLRTLDCIHQALQDGIPNLRHQE